MISTTAFLYKWTEVSTGMWYIGSRTANGCSPTDGYICSSKYVKPLILENRNNWDREILVIGDPLYIADSEVELLQAIDAANDPMSYNKHNSGSQFIVTGKIRVNNGVFNKFIDKDKMDLFTQSGYVKGMLATTKTKMKLNHADVSGKNNPMYGTNRVGHTLGRKHTVETKEKLQGPKTEAHKKKLSLGKQGKNHPMFGKTQSAETCDKRSASLKGRIPWNKGIKRAVQ